MYNSIGTLECSNVLISPGSYIAACRSLAIRISIPGTGLVSVPIIVGANLHKSRVLFQKYRTQLLQWDFSRTTSAADRAGTPQVRIKRQWFAQASRTFVIYSKFFVVNKTGVALRYRSVIRPKLSSNTVTDDQSLNAPTLAANAPASLRKSEGTDVTSDGRYCQLFGGDTVPILLDCSDHKMAVMPYKMISDEALDALHIYDLQTNSSFGYRVARSCQPGDEIHSDTDARIAEMPPTLFGKDLLCLLTPSADRNSDSENESFLSFMVCTCFSTS